MRIFVTSLAAAVVMAFALVASPAMAAATGDTGPSAGVTVPAVAQAASVKPQAAGAAAASSAKPQAASVANTAGQAKAKPAADAGKFEGQGEHITAKATGGHGSPLLMPEPGMIIWTLIVFVLLLIVLGKWVWPYILEALKDREAKLLNDFQEAEQARDEAQKTLAEYKAQLAEAQREAQRIIQKSRDDARRLAEQLKEKTQQDLTQMRQRMESDIEAAKRQAIGEVYEQTAVIATRIASRILHREIEPSDQRDLVDRSLREFSALGREERGSNHRNGDRHLDDDEVTV